MKKLKLTSLILVVVMLMGMIPFGALVAFAETTEHENVPLPATLPDGSPYYSVTFYEGASYEKAVSDKTIGSTDAWRTADGVMIALYTKDGVFNSGNNFNCYFQVTGGFAATSSYVRLSTQPNAKNFNDYQGYDGYSYCMYDGEYWEERLLGYSGYGSTSVAATTSVTKDGYTYVYIPIESFRYFGAGNGQYHGYGENETMTMMRDLIGMPATEFREIYEESTANFTFERYGGANLPIVRIDFTYNLEDHSRPEDSVTVPFAGASTSSDSLNASYVQSGNRVVVTNMPVDTLTDDYRVFFTDDVRDENDKSVVASTDLSQAAGVQVDVDSSQLGDAQLLLKLRMQMHQGPNAIFPNNTTVLNAWGTAGGANLTGEVVTVTDANGKVTEYPIYAYYENFSAIGSWAQFATRAGNAMAYITGVDSAGNVYNEAPIYTYGTTYSKTYDDAFALPAGFVGTVYIPMESYYLNVYGSYSSSLLMPFEQSPVKAFDAFGIFSTVKGTPTLGNKVIYENFSIVNRTGDVEINNEEEFLAFAEELASGNDFAGKRIKLNADLTFNEGWDAFADVVTKPEVVYPDMSGVTFAGSFDGQRHTISGLYMTGSDYCGFFGNVATGTTATVKNLDIENSCIYTKDAQGVGGIFGQVDNQQTTRPNFACLEITTNAIIDNVYLQINIFNDGSGNKDMGTAGFVGGTRANVKITKSVFDGQVKSGMRGISAFVGSTRPYRANYNGVADVDFYRLNVTIMDCVNFGTLIGTDGNQNFIGALVGYAGGRTENFRIANVTSLGYIYDAEDSTGACNGYLIGGGWSTPNKTRSSSLGDDTAQASNDYQRWNLKDVAYVETVGNDIGVMGNASTALAISYSTSGSTAANQNLGAAFSGKTLARRTYEELPEVLVVRYGEVEQGLLMNDGVALSAKISDRDLITKGDTATISVRVGTETKSATATAQNGLFVFPVVDKILPQELTKLQTYSATFGKTNISASISVQDILADVLNNEEMEASHALISDLIRYGAAAQEYWSVAEPLPTIGEGLALVEGEDGTVTKKIDALSFGSEEHPFGLMPQIGISGRLSVEIEVDPEKTYTAMVGNRMAEVEVLENSIRVYVYANEIDSVIVIMDDTGVSMTCSMTDCVAAALEDETGAFGDKEKALIEAMNAYCRSMMAYVNA